jgi:hypothetical protein
VVTNKLPFELGVLLLEVVHPKHDAIAASASALIHARNFIGILLRVYPRDAEARFLGYPFVYQECSGRANTTLGWNPLM